MFQTNDIVLYGVNGVCKIINITAKDLCGKKMNYYVLQEVYHTKSILFVPVDNTELTAKMKRILSSEEIKEMIRSMPDEKTFWMPNESQRKEKYAEILKSGDRSAFIRMIKTLYHHREELQQKGKKCILQMSVF